MGEAISIRKLERHEKAIVKDVLRNFDFVTVNRVMVALGWKWATKNGKQVPTIKMLRKKARELMLDVILDKPLSASQGGLTARMLPGMEGGYAIELSFVVSQYESYDEI